MQLSEILQFGKQKGRDGSIQGDCVIFEEGDKWVEVRNGITEENLDYILKTYL